MTWANETLVQIRWGGLTFIILEIVATAGFLIATAILTDQMKGQVLKSSALAMLFALGEDCRTVAGGIEGIGAMRRKARVLQVKLQGDTIELSGTPPTPPGRAQTSDSNDVRIEKRVEMTVTENKI
jgi:hypothetical protein